MGGVEEEDIFIHLPSYSSVRRMSPVGGKERGEKERKKKEQQLEKESAAVRIRIRGEGKRRKVFERINITEWNRCSMYLSPAGFKICRCESYSEKVVSTPEDSSVFFFLFEFPSSFSFSSLAASLSNSRSPLVSLSPSSLLLQHFTLHTRLDRN